MTQDFDAFELDDMDSEENPTGANQGIRRRVGRVLMIVKTKAGTLVVNDHANYVVQVGFDCKGKVVRVAGTIDKLHKEERKLQQLRESTRHCA